MTPLVARLVAVVADETGISVEAIAGRDRHAPIAAARHAVWTRLRVEHGWSWPAIAREFGRDHTTVMYGVRRALANQPAPARALVRVSVEDATRVA